MPAGGTLLTKTFGGSRLTEFDRTGAVALGDSCAFFASRDSCMNSIGFFPFSNYHFVFFVPILSVISDCVPVTGRGVLSAALWGFSCILLISFMYIFICLQYIKQ